MISTDLPELVDWRLAARVGRRVAGGSELPVRPAWSRQFTELSATADLAVAELTGLGGDLPPPVARPLDRGEWVEANLATLRRVLRPLAAKVAERKAWRAGGPVPAAMRSSTRVIAGAQAARAGSSAPPATRRPTRAASCQSTSSGTSVGRAVETTAAPGSRRRADPRLRQVDRYDLGRLKPGQKRT